jgi:hypothetical protein
MTVAYQDERRGCLQSRVPWDVYAKTRGVSITRLKELKRSPLHFQYRRNAPDVETAPLRLGIAAHCATLEPERFERDYAIWTRRTDSGRLAPRTGKAWDEFEASAVADGRRVLTDKEYESAMAISRAVRSDETARKFLATGDPEVTMEWQFNGRACKGRIDWHTQMDGGHVVVGLKTARDCRPFVFGSAAAKLGYHLQWAFYRDGYEAITGRVPAMVEIVVESAPPYAVATYVIPSDVIEQGREEYEDLMRILAECERENHWPGPVIGEQHLTLPSWAYESHDDIGDLGLEL